MNQPQKILIIGATSGIAENCARQWAQGQAVHFILVGRNFDKTERVAADLRVRSPQSKVESVQADFLEPSAIQATIDAIFALGPVDTVLIAHGSMPDQAELQNDLAANREVLEINGISPVLFAEACAGKMAKSGAGTLAVISSVAGDRGRKSNYIYGSAKGLVNRYVQGLQHRFAGTGIKVVLIKPGPTETPMTAHLKGKGPALAPVEQVAKAIVRGIDQGCPLVYAPAKWRVIMWVIRHLPPFVFKKLNI